MWKPRNNGPFQLRVRSRGCRKVKARCPPICGPSLSVKESAGYWSLLGSRCLASLHGTQTCSHSPTTHCQPESLRWRDSSAHFSIF